MLEINQLTITKKVLLIVPVEYFASIPFLIEFITSLSAQEVCVDILSPDRLDPVFELENDFIKIHSYQRKSGIIGNIYNLYSIFKLAKKLHGTARFSCIIGFSQFGIISSWFVKLIHRNVGLVYLNDELWFNDYEKSLSYYPLKFFEKKASRNADFTVTQDSVRGKLLSCINQINRERIFFLPNSRLGQSGFRSSIYLHQKISARPDKKIILWIGAVSDGDGALELALESNEWCDDYLMVFHFRSQKLTPYKKKILAHSGKGNVHVIEGDFSYAELPDVFSSAHIGIAYYPDRGINARYICRSSGKINSFLQCGVPCIVSNLAGLLWVEKSGSGKCIDDIYGVTAAIKTIEDDYRNYSRNACDTFDSELSIDKPLSELVERIHVLSKEGV